MSDCCGKCNCGTKNVDEGPQIMVNYCDLDELLNLISDKDIDAMFNLDSGRCISCNRKRGSKKGHRKSCIYTRMCDLLDLAWV